MSEAEELYKKKAVPLLERLAKEMDFKNLDGFEKALDLNATFLRYNDSEITKKMLLQRLAHICAEEQEKAVRLARKEEQVNNVLKEFGGTEKYQQLVKEVRLETAKEIQKLLREHKYKTHENAEQEFVDWYLDEMVSAIETKYVLSVKPQTDDKES